MTSSSITEKVGLPELADERSQHILNAAKKLRVKVSERTVRFVLQEPERLVQETFKSKHGAAAWTVSSVFSPKECSRICAYLSRSKNICPVHMKPSYRKCDRLVVSSIEYSTKIFSRLRPILQRRGLLTKIFGQKSGHAFCGTWKAVGLNPKWRFVRYKPGGHFAPHIDGAYIENSETRSLYTINVYLNECDERAGGETVFCSSDQKLHKEDGVFVATSTKATIRPIAGLALIFPQPPAEMLHAGLPLRRGEKYLARSDIMYRRVPETRPRLTPRQQQGLDAFRKAKEAEAAGRFGIAMRMYSRSYRLWPALEISDGAIAGV